MPRQVTFAFFLALAAAAMIAPRITIVAFFSCAITSVIYLWRMDERITATPFLTPITIPFLAILTYCAINACWAVDVHEAYTKVGLLLAILAGTYVAARVIETGRAEDMHILGCALPLAAIIAGAYLVTELLSDQALLRGLYNYVPWTRPGDAKHVAFQGAAISWISPARLNKAAACFIMVIFPLALMLRCNWKVKWRSVILSALAAATVVVAFFSEHEASKVALVASLLTYLLSRFYLKAAHLLTVAAWISAFVLVVPMAHLLHGAGLHQAQWLPNSARMRVIIWKETADRTAEVPILGKGLRSAKVEHLRALKELNQNPQKAQSSDLKTALHPHNVYLQIWYELGVIGALLFCIAGTSVIRWIARCPEDTQTYGYATFAGVATIAMFSWGMWQAWYLYATALTALLFLLANRLNNESARKA